MRIHSAYDERAVLHRISEGEEAAFHELFDAYQRKIYTYILRITGSPELAEDAVQDIFLKLWTGRESLTGINNINAYLHRMAQNRAISGFRKVARETVALAALQAEARSDSLHPEQQLLSKEAAAYVRQRIDQLTPQQRTVFLLSREQGMKQEAIAQQLNISVLTVKKHIGDALRILRDDIGREFGPYAIAIYVIFQLGLPGG